MITRAAVHYTHEHPEVTFHTMARLNSIERHLRTLIAIALAVFPHRIPTDAAEAWRAEADQGIAPLSYQWLADLLLFAEWDADTADRIAMEGRFG